MQPPAVSGLNLQVVKLSAARSLNSVYGLNFGVLVRPVSLLRILRYWPF